MLCVEIGSPDAQDLARLAQFLEPLGSFKPTWHIIVPPMELHDIETFHAQALQRCVDYLLNVGLIDHRQDRKVRHELGVDANSGKHLASTKVGVALAVRTERSRRW